MTTKTFCSRHGAQPEQNNTAQPATPLRQDIYEFVVSAPTDTKPKGEKDRYELACYWCCTKINCNTQPSSKRANNALLVTQTTKGIQRTSEAPLKIANMLSKIATPVIHGPSPSDSYSADCLRQQSHRTPTWQTTSTSHLWEVA